MSEELWSRIVEFNDSHFLNWRTLPEVYWSNAIAGEAGELCNVVKHRTGGGTHHCDEPASRVLEELADIFIYSVLACEILGCNLEAFLLAVKAKVLENERRMADSTRTVRKP